MVSLEKFHSTDLITKRVTFIPLLKMHSMVLPNTTVITPTCKIAIYIIYVEV